MKAKYQETPWYEIAGMWDVLIHAYFRTDGRLIYISATQDIPDI